MYFRLETAAKPLLLCAKKSTQKKPPTTNVQQLLPKITSVHMNNVSESAFNIELEYSKLLFTDRSVESLSTLLKVGEEGLLSDNEKGSEETISAQGNSKLLELFIFSIDEYMKGLFTVRNTLAFDVVKIIDKFGLHNFRDFLAEHLVTVMDKYHNALLKKTYHFHNQRFLSEYFGVTYKGSDGKELLEKHTLIHTQSMSVGEVFKGKRMPDSLHNRNRDAGKEIRRNIENIKGITMSVAYSVLTANCSPRACMLSGSEVDERVPIWVGLHREAFDGVKDAQTAKKNRGSFKKKGKNLVSVAQQPVEHVSETRATALRSSSKATSSEKSGSYAVLVACKPTRSVKQKVVHTTSLVAPAAATAIATTTITPTRRLPNKSSRDASKTREVDVESTTGGLNVGLFCDIIQSEHIAESPATPPDVLQLDDIYFEHASSEFNDDIYVYIDGKLQSLERMECTSAREFNAHVMQSADLEGHIAISMAHGAIKHNFPRIPEIIVDHMQDAKATNASNAIINETPTTSDNAVLNDEDDDRRCTTTTFTKNKDQELQLFLADLHQILVRLRIIHPDSKFVNSLGVPGCEILVKLLGLKRQGAHTDFWTTGYLTYLQTVLNPARKFNKAKCGGYSCFVNGTSEDDWIHLSNTVSLRIPAYGILVIAGNLEHYGGDNFRDPSQVLKLFFYIDPPEYDRAKSILKDKVFPVIDRSAVIRLFKEPMSHICSIPYSSYGCCGPRGVTAVVGVRMTCPYDNCDDMYYTYPYCINCLLDCGIVFRCDKVTRQRQFPYTDDSGVEHVQLRKYSVSAFSARRSPETGIIPDHTFLSDCPVLGNIMTEVEYHDKYPMLRGHMVDAIQMRSYAAACVESQHVFPKKSLSKHSSSTKFLDVTSLRSFVGGFRQSNDFEGCNLEVLLCGKNTRPLLYTLKCIQPADEYVLYNPLFSEKPVYRTQFDAVMMLSVNEM